FTAPFRPSQRRQRRSAPRIRHHELGEEPGRGELPAATARPRTASHQLRCPAVPETTAPYAGRRGERGSTHTRQAWLQESRRHRRRVSTRPKTTAALGETSSDRRRVDG